MIIFKTGFSLVLFITIFNIIKAYRFIKKRQKAKYLIELEMKKEREIYENDKNKKSE